MQHSSLSRKNFLQVCDKHLMPVERPLLCLLLSCCLYFFQSSEHLIECTFAASAAGQQLASGGSVAALGLPANSRSGYLLNMNKQLNLPVTSHVSSSNNLRLQSTALLGSALTAASKLADVKSGAQSTLDFSSSSYDQNIEEQELAEWLLSSQEMAPPDCYSNILAKFDNWSKKFKALEKINGNKHSSDATMTTTMMTKSADQVIRDSLIKASKALVEEECEKYDDDEGSSETNTGDESWQSGLDWQNSMGNSDYVYKTFQKTLQFMDTFLQKATQLKGIYDDIKSAVDYEINSNDSLTYTTKINEERAKLVLEKLKERAINYATSKLKGKLKGMLQNAGIQQVSSVLTNQLDYPGNPMSYLEPMLQVASSDSVKLVNDLLSNLPFRGALALINQMNPMPFMKCKPKDKNPEPYC